MAHLSSLGIRLSSRHHGNHDASVTYVQPTHPLRRILSFTGRTIDDVVNDPIARNHVLGYYKLHKFMHRRSEIHDLERQWNDPV